MSLLIFAATEMEWQPLSAKLAGEELPRNIAPPSFICSGPGLMNATFAITRAIMELRPSVVLQIGIAGSYADTFPPGTAVAISSECLGDAGAWEKENFRDLFDLGLLNPDQAPFVNKLLPNPHLEKWPLKGLPLVSGISVNEVTTHRPKIEQLKQKYKAISESMEGAAFHYAALSLKVPFLQLRGISNFIGERDKSKWQIEKALDEVSRAAIRFLTQDLS